MSWYDLEARASLEDFLEGFLGICGERVMAVFSPRDAIPSR
jgi:hypothetical protein